MEQQTPDPKLIETMAINYFSQSKEIWESFTNEQKERVRIRMRKIWEEVYLPLPPSDVKPMAQQTAITKTAVEWFAEQAEKILIDLKKNNNTFQLELCLQGINQLEEQAKQIEKEQRFNAQMDMFFEFNNGFVGNTYLNRRNAALKYAEHYNNKTYNKSRDIHNKLD